VIAPRKLSVSTYSPHYNEQALLWVDRVFCDGEWFPNCVAYDLDEGWLINKVNGVWAPRKYGVITVTIRDIPRLPKRPTR
jgi:hypothetical protein